MNRSLALLAAAIKAHRAVFALERCDACGAGWDRQEGEECRWCADLAVNMRRWQAELTLQPPNVDPDDITYDGVMRGWAERLAVAVDAGLIDRAKAERAWRRATSDV